MSDKGFFHWFEENHRPILYILLLLCIIVPTMNPIGVPISISPLTTDVYSFIQDLEPGSAIMVGNLLDALSYPEIGAFGPALMYHCFRENIKVIVFNANRQSGFLWIQVMEEVDTTGKIYGVDWVETTYIPGGEELVITRFLADFSVVNTDWYGEPVANIPILQEFKNANDVELYVDFETGRIVDAIVRQVTPYTDLVHAIRGGDLPTALPYYEAEVIVGIINSARGSAEYELLIGQPGKAIAQIDIVSIGHIMTIAVLLLGNIPILLSKIRGDKSENLGAEEND